MICNLELTRVLEAVKARLPGGVFPETYAALDLETSGLSVENDRAVSVGLCVVEGRRPVWVSSRILYRPTLRLAEQAVAVHGITRDVMNRTGEDPSVVFRDMLKTVKDYPVLLGYNAHRFDRPMLRNDLITFLGTNAWKEFSEVPLVDVGLVLKAVLAREPVFRADTLPVLYDRVAVKRAAVRWSLDWASAELKLAARADRHDAGEDAERTTAVWEALRRTACV